jgi:hypothetical protein
MSKRREGSGARAHLQKAHGIARGSDDQGECPRIKTRLPRLLPNWLLFPSSFPTRAQRPANISAQHEKPLDSDFPPQACCSLTPLLALLPFLYANSPPPVICSCFLIQATHPRPQNFCFITPQKGFLCCTAAFLAARHQFSPQDFICHKDSDTREPPLLFATRNRAISLLLNASRNVFHGYDPD